MAKYTKKRHRFYFRALRPVAWMIAKKYHFTTKPINTKGQQYLILSNHQGVMDPIFVALSFKTPIYFLASDTMFNTKLYSRLLVHCFGPVKKRKNSVDINCIRSVLQIVKEGGSVAFFPEGNRAWCDFQFTIDMATCKFIRMLKLPVVLYNFSGSYGVNPRWSKAIRKGPNKGEVVKILSWEEICALSDDQLLKIITDALRVFDSDSGAQYTSKRRAEYLERMLFVCPKCGSWHTLQSKGANVVCSHCGLTVEYTPDLHLASTDADFTFTRLVDWYVYQQNVVANCQIPQGEIFGDDGVTLTDKTQLKAVRLGKGRLVLTDNALVLGQHSLPLSEITGATVVGGKKLIVNTREKSYLYVGGDRFNVIKYLLMFNRVCKNISDMGGDRYYGLSIDTERK